MANLYERVEDLIAGSGSMNEAQKTALLKRVHEMCKRVPGESPDPATERLQSLEKALGAETPFDDLLALVRRPLVDRYFDGSKGGGLER